MSACTQTLVRGTTDVGDRDCVDNGQGEVDEACGPVGDGGRTMTIGADHTGTTCQKEIVLPFPQTPSTLS